MRKYKVKGFEDSFGEIDEDLRPVRLRSMDKSAISFPVLQEIGEGEERINFNEMDVDVCFCFNLFDLILLCEVLLGLKHPGVGVE